MIAYPNPLADALDLQCRRCGIWLADPHPDAAGLCDHCEQDAVTCRDCRIDAHIDDVDWIDLCDDCAEHAAWADITITIPALEGTHR